MLLALPSLGSAGPYRNFYSTGYCYPSYQSYSYYTPSYYQVPTYTAPAAPYVAPPTYSADWKAEAVKYVAGQKDLEAFNKFMSENVPAFAASHSTYYPGAGSTLYGVAPYSVKVATSTENVGVNLELADQRTARLLSSTQDSYTQGLAQRTEFLAVASADTAREREINAKRDSAALVLQQAAALLQATNASASSKTTTVVSGTGVAPVVQPATADRSAFIKSVARADCQECHTPGPKMKGNFSVEAIGSLNRAQANEILRRITSTDPAVVMPKPAAGQPVKHVSDEHMAAWVSMLSQVQ